MQLKEIKAAVQAHHDELVLPNRHGYVDARTVPTSSGCFYPLAGTLTLGRNTPLYIVFHGAGAPITWDGLRSEQAFNECMLAHKQPFNDFKGNDHSKRWVEYLLSDKSPWRELLPHMMEFDPDYINNAGFIFSSIRDLPKRLVYNFALAVRFPWEMPRNYELCTRLWDNGVEPNTAVYISMNFSLTEKAGDLNGPYDVRYPWSFLEESGLEAAGRFITAAPGDLSVSASSATENVANLWKSSKVTESKEILDDFIKNDNLTLDYILGGLSVCTSTQRKEWE